MIEAVFEDPALKKSVYAEVVPLLTEDALLGSNTSTLPITGLAEGVDRPEDFIGLHFFSPVDKMQLLEIVVGKETSDEALAKAIDVALQIRKSADRRQRQPRLLHQPGHRRPSSPRPRRWSVRACRPTAWSRRPCRPATRWASSR